MLIKWIWKAFAIQIISSTPGRFAELADSGKLSAIIGNKQGRATADPALFCAMSYYSEHKICCVDVGAGLKSATTLPITDAPQLMLRVVSMGNHY